MFLWRQLTTTIGAQPYLKDSELRKSEPSDLCSDQPGGRILSVQHLNYLALFEWHRVAIARLGREVLYGDENGQSACFGALKRFA